MYFLLLASLSFAMKRNAQSGFDRLPEGSTQFEPLFTSNQQQMQNGANGASSSKDYSLLPIEDFLKLQTCCVCGELAPEALDEFVCSRVNNCRCSSRGNRHISCDPSLCLSTHDTSNGYKQIDGKFFRHEERPTFKKRRLHNYKSDDQAVESSAASEGEGSKGYGDSVSLLTPYPLYRSKSKKDSEKELSESKMKHAPSCLELTFPCLK